MTSGTSWRYTGYRADPGQASPGVVAFLRRTLASQPAPINDDLYTPSSSTVVWAVRRDWPVDGTHEFVCPRSNQRPAVRQLAKDQAFWGRGPIRPRLSVVCMSAHEFALHARARRDCRAPDCAAAGDAAQARWVA